MQTCRNGSVKFSQQSHSHFQRFLSLANVHTAPDMVSWLGIDGLSCSELGPTLRNESLRIFLGASFSHVVLHLPADPFARGAPHLSTDQRSAPGKLLTLGDANASTTAVFNVVTG